MVEGAVYSIAAYVAGMVALFAPCCITFLLPAYLGSVFKEKEKVLLMTMVFGLGIFVTLVPAVVGVSLVSKALFRYHDTIYYLGGIVMLIVAFVTLLGLKLPMPNFVQKNHPQKVGIVSVFTLGIFSGITSACCAPVLIGILSFAFLSPNFWGALLIGALYVMGMVTPLLLISLFLNNKIPKLEVIRKPMGTIRLFGHSYPILLNNLVAFCIFATSGIFTLLLNSQGKLSMARNEDFARMIQNTGGYVNQYVGGSIWLNLLFLGGILLFGYYLRKKL